MSEPNVILCAKNSVTSSALSNVEVGEIQCRRKKHRVDIVEDKKKKSQKRYRKIQFREYYSAHNVDI